MLQRRQYLFVMGSYGTHRFLIQGFIALLLTNVVELSTTIEKAPHLTNEDPVGADLARLSGRMVNGTEATLGQFPHQVSLQYTETGKHFCGGSIIAAEWILTAASCVFVLTEVPLEPWQITIVAGDLRLNETSPTSQISEAIEVIAHPDWEILMFRNDVALVRSAKPFTFENSTVQYIELQRSAVAVGTTCQVAGWGYPEYRDDRTTNELMYIEAPIIGRTLCTELYIFYSTIPEGMICAGYVQGMKGFCEADFGGGLICDGYLAGVVSWSHGCATPNYPGVYADVTYYLPWISEHVTSFVTEEDDHADSGATKFSLWMQLMSFALVGLLAKS